MTVEIASYRRRPEEVFVIKLGGHWDIQGLIRWPDESGFPTQPDMAIVIDPAKCAARLVRQHWLENSYLPLEPMHE